MTFIFWFYTLYILYTHPDAIENITIWVNSDIEVWLDDIVKLSLLFIPEERIRHPDFGAVGHCEVLDLAPHIIIFEPVVVPLLPESDLDTEFHLDIIYFLETPHKQRTCHHCGSSEVI